jgi:carboxymethylenebutenolidase
MRKTMVDVPTRDGVADAYLVRPDGVGPAPGVLVYQDAFGLRPRLTEMADRIAARGYVVLVPNLLYRGGRAPQFDLSDLADPDRRGGVIGEIMPLVRALTTDLIVSDAGSYLDFLAAQDGVAPGAVPLPAPGPPDGAENQGPAVALVGYCMGGMNAIRTAEAYPDRIAAVGSFHAGRLVTDQPDSPHLRVGEITAELYLAHADNDGSMTPENIETLEAALDRAGVRYTSELYEGTRHGFTMADTAAYSEAGEKRHWTNLFALLDRALPAHPRS